MTTNCNSGCDECSAECKDREKNNVKEFLKEPLVAGSRVKKTIGIISGKGGVGKSLVTSLLAGIAAKEGKKTALMDGDITGPSIPKMFGMQEQLYADEKGNIIPAISKNGTKIVSINLMLENPSDPVVWRGPVIADIIKQFWSKVNWGDVDFMFIDMPPGTGDVALTVFQSVPVDGIIIVTTPQDLVSMIVKKAVKMAEMMKIPVLGLIENMAYATCPDCGKKIEIFGKSGLENTAKHMGLQSIVFLPIDPEVANFCDKGEIGNFKAPWLDEFRESIKKVLNF